MKAVFFSGGETLKNINLDCPDTHFGGLNLSVAKNLSYKAPYECLALVCGPPKPGLLHSMSHGKYSGAVLRGI